MRKANSFSSSESPGTSKSTKSAKAARSSRRRFLGQAAAATIAVGAINALEPLLGLEGSVAEAVEITPTSDSTRAENSKTIRKTAADNEKALGLFPHPTNGDEGLYSNRIGNFHKTLPHNETTG